MKGEKQIVLLVMVFMIMSLISGCAAYQPPQPPLNELYVLSQSGTINTALAVFKGTVPYARVLMRGDCLAIMWPVQQVGWATVFFDVKNFVFINTPAEVQAVIGQANIFNSRNMQAFVEFMMQEGFRDVDPRMAPPTVVAALEVAKNAKVNPMLFVVILPMVPSDGNWVNNLFPVVEQ